MVNVHGFFKKITPKFALNWYHALMPFLGALIFRFPSGKIKVIGVTGTNGKTTTVGMISKILQEAGHRTAFLSSIKFQIDKEEWPNMMKMTMPGRMIIQKFLRNAVNKKCEYAILEVSSEGIKQRRHLFVNFDVALITNLSPEHIEAHGSFEKYKKAKGELFRITKNNHIVNADDENAEYFLKFPSNKKFCYGIKSESHKAKTPDCFFLEGTDIKASGEGLFFEINGIPFNLYLLGRFNVYNALAAISTGIACGIDLETCKKALEKFEAVPGRMEEVISQPFKVIVDYAVTPDSLEALYKSIEEMTSCKRIIAVFGSCGGGRDKWRRPILGKIAKKYCHKIIITNEDPYDEDPMEIINSIAEAAGEKSVKILDRREAIREALKFAKDQDVVVITGKGCEPWMCVADNKKIPWDDREIVREEIARIKKRNG